MCEKNNIINVTYLILLDIVLITGYTILCDSNIPWSHNRYSKHHIMSRLAKKNRVIFVDPPRAPGIQVREFGLSALAGHIWRPESEDLMVLTPTRLPWVSKFDFMVNTADPRFFISQIKRALDRFDPRTLVLFLGNPWNTHLLSAFPDAACTLYHCSDNFPALFPGSFAERIREHEQEMLRKVDVVIAVNAILFKKCHAVNHDTVMLKHGVDERFYYDPQMTGVIPDDLTRIRKPIAGFIGSIDDTIDFTLMALILEKHKDVSFVFIGPVTVKSNNLLQQLQHHDNFHYLGVKKWINLPAYLSTTP